jgi:hypothetical protein
MPGLLSQALLFRQDAMPSFQADALSQLQVEIVRVGAQQIKSFRCRDVCQLLKQVGDLLTLLVVVEIARRR